MDVTAHGYGAESGVELASGSLVPEERNDDEDEVAVAPQEDEVQQETISEADSEDLETDEEQKETIEMLRNIIQCDGEDYCRVIKRDDLPNESNYDQGETSCEECDRDYCACSEDNRKEILLDLVEEVKRDFEKYASVPGRNVEILSFMLKSYLLLARAKTEILEYDASFLDNVINEID